MTLPHAQSYGTRDCLPTVRGKEKKKEREREKES
jgi:hypothetical protein